MLTTLTDRKLHRDFNLNDTADFYCSDTTSFHDYYPYGMEKPGRGSNPTGYRFGFNGVEADNALMPGRTGYHTYFRQYDTRTARWFSVDPVVHPWQSPYNAMDGNPIYFADPGGANTIAREEDPDIFDTETTGTDPACPGPANEPTGGEWFKFENTIGFDPLAGKKNNISNPSTENPPMQDNSAAVQNSYSFENNMQAEGGGEKEKGRRVNVPGGDWDSWGEGTVPYRGTRIGGTNFVGSGPPGDPRAAKLQYIDEIDAFAFFHDLAYYRHGVSGFRAIRFNTTVVFADLQLVNAAASIMDRYFQNGIDQITGFPISERTFNIARAVYIFYAPIVIDKYRRLGNFNPRIQHPYR